MVSKVTPVAEAVKQIPDDATVTVSSSSGLGCPDLVLRAIGERFDAEAHPKNLTMLHPIAAGDMYGIKGIDHIAKEGLIGRVIAGSYPSGPSSKPMPEIWKMIVEDRVEAYNVPSGILFDMHRDVAARKPGVMTQVGLCTFVDPIREGCAMNPSAEKNPIVQRREIDGETWLHFANIVPDVAIIRGTTADEKGNITYEHEGAYLGGLELAIAVRNHGGLVIAQVKRVTANGSLRPHDVHIPGNLVDLVVVDPDQKQATEIIYDPVISGEVMLPWSGFEFAEYGLEKVIARRAAMELGEGQSAALGFGISANVPRILLEEGHPQSVTWAIEQGAVGGVPLTGFAFGCAANADSILPSPSQFTYFQGG
jgi:acyl CoA:acetate/3-ketoacid CoA transferase